MAKQVRTDIHRDSDKKNSKKKAEQLGMSYGTARNRLIKQMMFRLAQELGYDKCFQCGNVIESETELSIEHKIPWLDSDNPLELFYDQNNLAFSHLSCNAGASRNTPIKSKNSTSYVGKSGFKGVQNNKVGKCKYIARIAYDGKYHHIAYGDDARKLAELYDKRAIEVHGSEAVTNKMLGLL